MGAATAKLDRQLGEKKEPSGGGKRIAPERFRVAPQAILSVTDHSERVHPFTVCGKSGEPEGRSAVRAAGAESRARAFKLTFRIQSSQSARTELAAAFPNAD